MAVRNPLIPILALWAASLALPVSAYSAEPRECAPGGKALFYSPHPMLDARTAPGFADSLRSRLTGPLRELGYCLEPIVDYRSLLDTARFGDHLVLHALAGESAQPASPAGSPGILLTVLRGRDWAANRLPEAVSRPLVSLPFTREDPAGLLDVLSRKAAEGLRRSYVAHVLIQSRPGEARVEASNGLQGTTPVEWILPLGSLSVSLEKAGHLALRRELDLAAPGQHNYDLQMAKRRFYHSRFIWPALVFGASALGAYAMEDHYYSRYQGYGADVARNRPDAFGHTFRLARTYERIAAGSFFMAGSCLALSFRF